MSVPYFYNFVALEGAWFYCEASEVVEQIVLQEKAAQDLMTSQQQRCTRSTRAAAPPCMSKMSRAGAVTTER